MNVFYFFPLSPFANFSRFLIDCCLCLVKNICIFEAQVGWDLIVYLVDLDDQTTEPAAARKKIKIHV